jgi:cholesterol transport system auxiliary component
MRKMSESLHKFFVLVCLLAFYGCSIGPADRSAPHTYLLNPEFSFKSFSANTGRTGHGTLLVSVPKAQPGFDTPRMAYLLRPHEVSYYAFNQWADTPSRMLAALLAQAMEMTGLWRAVVQAPSTVRAEYRLDCDNLVLEQQFFSASRVRLALRAQLIDVKRQSVMDARDFEVFEDAPSDDAYGGVIAANRATARLLAGVVGWAAAIMDESTGAKR